MIGQTRLLCKGPFKWHLQVLRNAAWGGGGVSFPGKKRYKGVRLNVISVTTGWVRVKFPGKKRYVKLEWPLNSPLLVDSKILKPMKKMQGITNIALF